MPPIGGQRPARRREGVGPLGRLAGGGGIVGERQTGPLEQLDEQVDVVLGRDGEPPAKIGQALADEAFGGVDEQDRRLEPALPVDEVGLLPGVLEVVARVRLVGDGADKAGGAEPAGRC